MRRLLLAVFGSLLLSSCESGAGANGTAEPTLVSQWSGLHAGTDAAASRVIRTADDWRALWQQLGREPPHAFNPQRETAVAIFLGERRTAGYAAEIVAVTGDPQGLTVTYRETSPAPDMMVAQMLTSPWTVAILSVPAAEVTFRPARE